MPPSGWWTPRRIAWGLAGLASLTVLLTLGDPGITIDEPLDVRPGRTYVATLRAKGSPVLRSRDRRHGVPRQRRASAAGPLAAWGLPRRFGEPFEHPAGEGGRDPIGLYVVAGRLAPALTFGALVGLISADGRKAPRAGVGGGRGRQPGRSCPGRSPMPTSGRSIPSSRSSGRFALLSAVRADRRGVGRSSGWRFAGLAWGLALLTKIHAWFLPPIVLGLGLEPVEARSGRWRACSIWAVGRPVDVLRRAGRGSGPTPVESAPGVPGNGRRPDLDPGPLLRPGLTPIATSPGTTRGSTSLATVPDGLAGARRPGGSIRGGDAIRRFDAVRPSLLAGSIGVFLRGLQHENPRLRRRTPVPRGRLPLVRDPRSVGGSRSLWSRAGRKRPGGARRP